MTRKIDAMHRYFGVTAGEHCKSCCHCISGQYRSKSLRKCEVYGMTHSEATDWAKNWMACGLFNKPYEGERVMDRALYDATGRRTAERRYYAANADRERARAKHRYWADPEAARAANAYQRRKRKLVGA